MRIQGLIASTVVVVALLSGCVGAEPYAFLQEDVAPEDSLDAAIVDQAGIDPDTVRFQGEWEDHRIYLALVPGEVADDVALVLVPLEEPDAWAAASGRGDRQMTVSGPAGVEAAYIPVGADEPAGDWAELSDWVVVRD